MYLGCFVYNCGCPILCCNEALSKGFARQGRGTGGEERLNTSVNLDEIAARLPCTPHPEMVSLYTKLIGELMFIAINTHPLIAQPVNALARFMTTANAELYVHHIPRGGKPLR